MKEYRMTCYCCGADFIGNSKNAKYCLECKETERKRLSAEAKHNARIRKQNRKSAESRKSLVEFLKEIDTYNKEHGTSLSYGQYVSMEKFNR